MAARAPWRRRRPRPWSTDRKPMTDSPETTDASKPKRRPGRPKGLGKVAGSGRKPGTPNRDRAITRDFIIKEGAPVQFLCNVIKGRRFSRALEPGDKARVHVYPTLDQGLTAARILVSKIVPDLKSVEHVGEDGGNLVIRIVRFGDNS